MWVACLCPRSVWRRPMHPPRSEECPCSKPFWWGQTTRKQPQAVVVAADVARLAGWQDAHRDGLRPQVRTCGPSPPRTATSTTVHPANTLLASLSEVGKERGLEVEVHASTGAVRPKPSSRWPSRRGQISSWSATKA